jgi:hypothetical protein
LIVFDLIEFDSIFDDIETVRQPRQGRPVFYGFKEQSGANVAEGAVPLWREVAGQREGVLHL